MAPDEYLGRVEPDGKVYEDQFGPDHYVGRVDLETGRIYESRLGPDKYIGRVDARSGKVYHAQMGPDEYLGRVEPDGKSYLHKPLAADVYLGRTQELVSLSHGGAAFMLLILPKIEEVKDAKLETKPGEAPLPGEAGTTPEQA